MNARYSWFLILFLLLAGCASDPAGDVSHIVDSGSSAIGPTLPSALSARVHAAAVEYQRYAPIPRLALWDAAYPASLEEWHALHGYGVILIVARSQDDSELPLKRVYAMSDGRVVKLTLVHSVRLKSSSDALADKVFGASNWAGIYLLPMALVADDATLQVDFLVHRKAFSIGELAPSSLQGLGYRAPIEKGAMPQAVPLATAVDALIRREYPGFGIGAGVK